MKVVSAETIQAIDRRAISEFGLAGLTLMENAGRSCAEAIIAEFGRLARPKAVVVAGKGNNGGDGFVIARLLQQQGWEVKVFVLAGRGEIRGDAAVNLDRLADAAVILSPAASGLAGYSAELAGATVIVDALFGTGLNSEVKGAYADAIALVNGAGKPV